MAITCPVCDQRFEIAIRAKDPEIWPIDRDLPTTDYDEFEVERRTKAGAVEACKNDESSETTIYVHLPR